MYFSVILSHLKNIVLEWNTLYKDFPPGTSEWPKDEVFDFLVYLIKKGVFGNF